MNEQEVASLVWYNGNVFQKEKIFAACNFSFLFSSNITECFFTSGTEILFFSKTLSKIQSQLKRCKINSELFADESGEIFRNETKRLLIRNKYYKTARCYILHSQSPETGALNEFIFLVPDMLLFESDKVIKKAIVSNLSLKPSGTVMNIPTLENEFRKIVRTEIECEKADDCIILNQDQHIVESYLGNIFLIENSRVLTPSLKSGCNPLLLRNIIINAFGQLNFQVAEKDDLKVENLFDAIEVIVAGETGIYSLKGIEYKRYFDKTRKILIPKILEAGLD